MISGANRLYTAERTIHYHPRFSQNDKIRKHQNNLFRKKTGITVWCGQQVNTAHKNKSYGNKTNQFSLPFVESFEIEPREKPLLVFVDGTPIFTNIMLLNVYEASSEASMFANPLSSLLWLHSRVCNFYVQGKMHWNYHLENFQNGAQCYLSEVIYF